jgi:hypothetical protein
MQEFEKPNWSLASIDTGSKDLGWAEGVLTDGRPYYLEWWQTEGSQLATVYFSTKDLAETPAERLCRLLVDAEIIALKQESLTVEAGIVQDSLGQQLVSVNVLLSDPLEQYAQVVVPTSEYEK